MGLSCHRAPGRRHGPEVVLDMEPSPTAPWAGATVPRWCAAQAKLRAVRKYSMRMAVRAPRWRSTRAKLRTAEARCADGCNGPEVPLGTRPGRHRAPGERYGSEAVRGAKRLPSPDDGPRSEVALDAGETRGGAVVSLRRTPCRCRPDPAGMSGGRGRQSWLSGSVTASGFSMAASAARRR